MLRGGPGPGLSVGTELLTTTTTTREDVSTSNVSKFVQRLLPVPHGFGFSHCVTPVCELT